MVSSITLKWNIFRTIRGIYKWSMATIFQLILIATQEYCYPRKCEVVMLMILCILEGKHLYSVLTLQLWLPLEPHLHSGSDCNGIFHNFKMKYLQNYKRYLQVVNGNNFSTYFDCYPRILLSQKMWSGHAHDSLHFRRKALILSFDTSVVTSFGASFAFRKWL